MIAPLAATGMAPPAAQSSSCPRRDPSCRLGSARRTGWRAWMSRSRQSPPSLLFRGFRADFENAERASREGPPCPRSRISPRMAGGDSRRTRHDAARLSRVGSIRARRSGHLAAQHGEPPPPASVRPRTSRTCPLELHHRHACRLRLAPAGGSLAPVFRPLRAPGCRVFAAGLASGLTSVVVPVEPPESPYLAHRIWSMAKIIRQGSDQQ